MANLPTWDETTPVIAETADLPTWDETTAVAETTEDDEPGFLDEGGQFDAAVKGIAHGLTLGYSEEIIAAGRSAFGDRTYAEELAEYKRELAEAKSNNPATYDIAEVGGSLAIPAGIVGKVAVRGVKAASGAIKAGKAVGVVNKAKDVATAATKAYDKIPGGIVKDLALEYALENATGVPGLAAVTKLHRAGKVGKKTYNKIKRYWDQKK